MRNFMENLGPPFILLAFFALLMFALVYSPYQSDKAAREVDKANNQICLTNGYAGYIDISGLNYCYRISGNQGELMLVEALSQEAGR